MTSTEAVEDGDLVFTIKAALLPKLDAWMRSVDEKVAEEQIRTGRLPDGAPLDEGALRVVRYSLERADPKPYYGVSGGAHTYSFTPTSSRLS